MLIAKKRIRSLASNLKGVRAGQAIYVALLTPAAHAQTLQACGFSEELAAGETVLPSANGPISSFNADGKYIKHTDQPKETAYRQMEWTWTEFHGPYERVEQSRVVDVPYERYPRSYVPPPAIELSVATTAEGNKVIVSPGFEYADENETLLHAVNLFLELFGECTILDSELNEPIRAPVRRLNWEVLPQGRMPWATLRPQLDRVIDRTPSGNQPVIEKRFQAINQHEPDFVAVGRAGFSGYLIFGFPDRNLYVLESTETNNATYILREDWERLSTLTKAEILGAELHERRVIHRENWFAEIEGILP